MNFQNLQPELIIIIFCFLDSHFLINTIALVCKRFHSIVNSNCIWKPRVKIISAKSLYVYQNEDDTDWKKIVYSFEAERLRWKHNAFNMNKYKIKTDVVHNTHLIDEGKFCVSDGFRGRSLKVWNLQELTDPGNIASTDILIGVQENAHELPIMSIASSGLQLCSGGADTMIHLWQLESDGFQRLYSAKCKSYVFSLSMHETVVAAGTVRFVNTYDMRNGLSPILEMPVHRQAVTDVYIDEDYLISSGTDAVVSIYDRRANKVLTEVQCPNSPKYINRISCGGGFLLGGDSQGAVHLWDMNGNFGLVKTFDIGHEQFITGLDHSTGCIISGCADGKLHVSSMSSQNTLWCTCLQRYVTDLHYMNKVLVSATNSDLITIWKPK